MRSPGDAAWGARTLLVAAVLAGVAVVLGAFGAHGLEGRVTPERLATFETGVRYHLVHALALLVLPSVSDRLGAGPLRAVARLWVSGTAVFAGSLYLLVLLDLSILGAVTPLGGILLIGGWGALAWRAGRSWREPRG